MNIFTSIPKGDSRTWIDQPQLLLDGRTVDASTWGLAYSLRGPSSIDLVATAVGRTWSTTLTAVQSAGLASGAYVWAAILTNGLERITAANGPLTIATDLASTTTPFDGRTVAQIALANCESAMATFNASGGKVKEYEIAGRRMIFTTIAEIMQLHSFWQMRVLGEGSADSIANGQGNPRKLFARFISPNGGFGGGGNGNGWYSNGVGYPP